MYLKHKNIHQFFHVKKVSIVKCSELFAQIEKIFRNNMLRYVFEFCAESLKSSLVTPRKMLLHGFSVNCAFQGMIVTVGQLAIIVLSLCWKCFIKWLADCCNFHQADSQCRFTLPEKQSARDSKIPVAGRGAARIFLRGGLKLWKQKPCKGKIACD